MPYLQVMPAMAAPRPTSVQARFSRTASALSDLVTIIQHIHFLLDTLAFLIRLRYHPLQLKYLLKVAELVVWVMRMAEKRS